MSDPAATTATATSAVFTEPIANRGGRPRWSRNGVTTGPQAPTRPLVTPPAAAATSTPRSLYGGSGIRVDVDAVDVGRGWAAAD